MCYTQVRIFILICVVDVPQRLMPPVPVPFRFRGLDIIGTVFFLLNIVLFVFNTFMISLRFYFFPETFKASVMHPTESLFVPASVVSFGTILINSSQYGLGETGNWLKTAVLVMFWIYCAMAMIASCTFYLLMYELIVPGMSCSPQFWLTISCFRWSTQTFTISRMTPIWIFPAYPLLIIGPYAGILSSQLSPKRALDIVIAGVILQGIGFMVSLMIYSAFVYRLMTHKLPKESSRPGMFVSVGPSGFTVSGIINMAANAHRVLPKDFMGDGAMAAMILKVMANWMGIWIWGYVVTFGYQLLEPRTVYIG